MSTITAFGELMMKLEVPDHKLLEQTNHLHISFSGTGLNVLCGLSKFGHTTSFVSTLPHNSIGEAGLSYIRKLGIHTSNVTLKGDYIGQYIIERGFSVRPSKVTYSNREESSFNLSTLSDYNINSIMENTELIHFCGIMLAISDNSRQLVLHMAEAAKRNGVTIVFDCNYRPKLWEESGADARYFYEKMLHYSDICLMTEKDAIQILGMETIQTTKEAQLEELLPCVATTYDIDIIAGLIRNTSAESQELKGFLYDGNVAYSNNYVYNTLERIGAGDGFCSGLLHGKLVDLPTADLVEFAAASSVLAHTTYGDSPVSSKSDVWRLIRGEHLHIER